MRLGILGGTFDPIHLGHLRSAVELGRKLALEKVYLIPSAAPPHKTEGPVTLFCHRLAMTRLAAGDSTLLGVMDLESRRPGPSYSIETLREFHKIFGPDPDLFFILGTDAFAEIKTWKEYRHLFDYAHFVIIARPGFHPNGLGPLLSDLDIEIKRGPRPDLFIAPSGKSIMLKTATLMDISSTGLREMVKNKRSIRYLVPESVRAYILEKGLYKTNASDR